jgi:hypothetical protein
LANVSVPRRAFLSQFRYFSGNWTSRAPSGTSRISKWQITECGRGSFVCVATSCVFFANGRRILLKSWRKSQKRKSGEVASSEEDEASDTATKASPKKKRLTKAKKSVIVKGQSQAKSVPAPTPAAAPATSQSKMGNLSESRVKRLPPKSTPTSRKRADDDNPPPPSRALKPRRAPKKSTPASRKRDDEALRQSLIASGQQSDSEDDDYNRDKPPPKRRATRVHKERIAAVHDDEEARSGED